LQKKIVNPKLFYLRMINSFPFRLLLRFNLRLFEPSHGHTNDLRSEEKVEDMDKHTDNLDKQKTVGTKQNNVAINACHHDTIKEKHDNKQHLVHFIQQVEMPFHCTKKPTDLKKWVCEFGDPEPERTLVAAHATEERVASDG